MNWKEILASVVFGLVVWYLWPFIAEFPHALMDVRSDILQEREARYRAALARKQAKADQGLKE